jgi:hypothetical protein
MQETSRGSIFPNDGAPHEAIADWAGKQLFTILLSIWKKIPRRDNS